MAPSAAIASASRHSLEARGALTKRGENPGEGVSATPRIALRCMRATEETSSRRIAR
jgi:hypothetical protein